MEPFDEEETRGLTTTGNSNVCGNICVTGKTTKFGTVTDNSLTESFIPPEKRQRQFFFLQIKTQPHNTKHFKTTNLSILSCLGMRGEQLNKKQNCNSQTFYRFQ